VKTAARIVFAVLLVCAAACGRREQPAPSKAAVQRHTLKGVIRSVDPARTEITVTHEEVPGYMAAMTMPFPVKDDPQVFALLRPGDKIEATLVVEGDKYWLEKVLTRGFVPTAGAAEATAAKVSAAVAGSATPRPNRAVGVGDSFPDFTLTDQTGARVRLSDFRGQPVAVTFIYTRCPIATACPLTTAKFSKIGAVMAQKGYGELLTLTLDPEHDTPKVLADYARMAGANPKRWKFLTGDPRDVAEVASRFGILYYPDQGQLVHGQGVAVIDPKGKLSTIYYGNEWQPEHIVRDMEKARTEG
jgi:protein SCO1/2